MKTFEVTFCYGKNRGNAHGEVVRAKSATNAIAVATKRVRDGKATGVKTRIEDVDATLFEVLVREWGIG